MMHKTLGRFLRRKSVTETELRKDYPTVSDDSDVTDDEHRRQEWQRHLNRRATVANVVPQLDTASEKTQWDYESEYNYSIGSASSIIDAYREHTRYPHQQFARPKHYTDMDIEQCIENRMKEELKMDQPKRYNPHSLHPADTRNKGRYGNPAHVNDKVKVFEEKSRHRPSLVPKDPVDMYDQADTVGKGKKKVLKQWKQRKRARDVSADNSDEEMHYSVNISMDELNSMIKKNINSAVKTIVTATKKGKIPHDDSFSTETETIFSGSSSHSTEIPSGLLHKQIKAQLDSDKLRGIIKHAVAKEAQELRRHSMQPSINVPTINEIPSSPMPSPNISPRSLDAHIGQGGQSPHDTNPFSYQYGGHNPHTVQPAHQHPVQHQYPGPPGAPPQPQQTQLPQHTLSPPVAGYQAPMVPPVPPPPPPPPAPPLPAQVTFNLPAEHSMFNPRSLHLPGLANRRPSVATMYSDEMGYDAMDELVPSADRLKNRRHTLATLTNDGLESGMDKLEQFSNALKLLDKTLKKDDDGSSGDKADSDKGAGAKSADAVAAEQANANISVPPIPGFSQSMAPFQSIADQIKALSKKPKKPLEPGELDMSSCCRMTLILTNIVFLICGSGLVGLGIWLMMDPQIETYFNIINVDQSSSSFKMICYALLGVGAVALFIAFMGCCGSIQKSKCMLTVFIIMVAVLTVLEGGLAALVMINPDSPAAVPVLSAIFANVGTKLEEKLKVSLIQMYMPETMMGKTWDIVQIQLECCGATGPDDYKLSLWKNETLPLTEYPDTCCKLVEKSITEPEPSNKLLCHFGSSGFFHDTGCYEKMAGWFTGNSMYIIAASGSILFIEVWSFIVAIIICKKGEKKTKKREQEEQQKRQQQQQGQPATTVQSGLTGLAAAMSKPM